MTESQYSSFSVWSDVPTINWKETFEQTQQRLASNNLVENPETVPEYELIKTASTNGYTPGKIKMALDAAKERDDIRSKGKQAYYIGTTDNRASKQDHSADSTAKAACSEPTSWNNITYKLVYQWCCEYYHGQLDRPLPDNVDHETPREYYREQRGWSDETIEEKELGYAPADGQGKFISRLRNRGATTNQILATGFFKESHTNSHHTPPVPEATKLDPVWKGRYVLPYSDPDNEQLFAISRRMGDGHPDDRAGWNKKEAKPAKYVKLAASFDHVRAEEPIYGLETIENEKPVLITEGIADAITTHQAGFPCISPVTTRFKKSDYKQLSNELTNKNIDRVYVIQDAEYPRCSKNSSAQTRHQNGDVRLETPQLGEGLKGAIDTAKHLKARGIDARVAELPRFGLDKTDLDAYLTEWDGDLKPVIASALPIDEHPAVRTDGAKPDDATIAPAELDISDPSENNSPVTTETDCSALFELDIEDVTGHSSEYRGKNPLGHHGNSTNYFTLYDEIAFDFKYKAAYTPLTYLLCRAGERSRSNPEGPLNDEEIFIAWKHAKEASLIADGDPIPARALTHVALSNDIVRTDDLEDDWQLPPGGYNATLQYIEEEYGLATGRTPIKNHTSVGIPFERLRLLDHDDARRYARKRDTEWPTTTDARDRLNEALRDAIEQEDEVVLDAPTALGKSYSVATTPWTDHEDVTGDAPVIHLHPTREARDQAFTESQQADVNAIRLLGRGEACPVAAGDHDPDESATTSSQQPPVADAEADTSEAESTGDADPTITMNGAPASLWFDAVCEGRGIPFSHAHAYLEQNNDQGIELPCCAEDGVECNAIAQWNGVPRTTDGDPVADIIHATNIFAHVPGLRHGTNIVFDEQPDFRTDISQDRIRTAVTAFLREAGAPVSTFEQLVSKAKDGEIIRNEHTRYQYMSEALDYEPDPEWYFEEPDAHTLAPALTKAIWYAFSPDDDENTAKDRNGLYHGSTIYEPPRLDANANDATGWNRTFVSVVIDETNTVRHVRQTPDFSQTRSIVGLDAHPCEVLWQQNVHPNIQCEPILASNERRLWRRFERGLTVVQVGDHTHPLTSGEYFNDRKTEAFFSAIREQYGDRFNTAITAASVEDETEELLESVGVTAPDTMHYGEEKSRGDFGDEDVGVLNGCIDPGDNYVLELLAEAGCEAEPSMVETTDGDTKRERGRTFTGPDSGVAKALLASVREQHVAQAAGRYARNADDPTDQAIVFVRTDAMPPGFADLQVPGVESVPTELHLQIINELRNREDATAADLAEAVGCSKEHVRTTLRDLHDDEIVQIAENAGMHGAHLYRALAGDDAIKSAGVSLSPQTTNDSVWGSYTCALAISGVPAPSTEQHRADTQTQSPTTVQQTLTGAFSDHPAD